MMVTRKFTKFRVDNDNFGYLYTWTLVDADEYSPTHGMEFYGENHKEQADSYEPIAIQELEALVATS
jgi:hypothetical protein